MTPLTQRQKQIIAKNVLAACKDINKLNKTGYNFLYLASGFIAHYNLQGFIAYYSEHSLKADIERNAKPNQWHNFRQGERDADYYHAKREWERNEEEMNKRMDIIGQNGNTGEHYE